MKPEPNKASKCCLTWQNTQNTLPKYEDTEEHEDGCVGITGWRYKYHLARLSFF